MHPPKPEMAEGGMEVAGVTEAEIATETNLTQKRPPKGSNSSSKKR